MRGGIDNARAGRRRPAARSSRKGARYIGVTMIGALAAAGLAACGTSSAGTGGPVTLNLYNFPDPSGAVQQAVDNCTAASHGKYKINYNKLQNAADQQRLQMARRIRHATTQRRTTACKPTNAASRTTWPRSASARSRKTSC